MDYYNILGVSQKCSPEEQPQESIQESKYATSIDRGGDELQTKEINEAYTALKDPKKTDV